MGEELLSIYKTTYQLKYAHKEWEKILHYYGCRHIYTSNLGCCYRPPNANNINLDSICDILESNTIVGQDIYFMGDFNIDWLASNCPMMNKLLFVALSKWLTNQQEYTRTDGTRTAACIDHIFTNCPERSNKTMSVPIGCSDHNLIISATNIKLSRPGSTIVLKRSYKHFNNELFEKDVRKVCWVDVLETENPKITLCKFNNLFMPLVEKHVPCC